MNRGASDRLGWRRALAALALALCKLHHLEFDAPWKAQGETEKAC